MGENPEIISKGYLSLSFAYIHSEKDILKLVTTLIANTKGEGKAGDDFWVSATRSLAVKSQRTNNKYRCLDNWQFDRWNDGVTP